MARTFLYMKDSLNKYILDNVKITEKDERIETPMAHGSHYRNYGTQTIQKLSFQMLFRKEEYTDWLNFFLSAKDRSFFAKFPLALRPEIDPEKYYLFQFSKAEEFETNTKKGLKYQVNVVWDWHVQVPPREYGDQTL